MQKAMIATFLLATTLNAVAHEDATDWINSPEASFATASERAEWFRLATDVQRAAFIKRYWLMRDPTPNTEKNEFKEVILDRIRKADAKFSIKDGAIGSFTAQGQVYVVFGPPAFVRNATGGGVLSGPNTMTEATDVTTTWIYDTHRTPHLMEMLGRPELEIVIVIEPTRRRDVLQTPGLFDQYRYVLAKRSIVNPPEIEIPPVTLNAKLPEGIREVLRDARPITRSPEGVVFSSFELWTVKGSSAIAAFAVPDAEESAAHLITYGEVRAGDQIVATVSQPFVITDATVSASRSRAEVVRLDLAPGLYAASFALMDDRNKQPLLAVKSALHVLDPAAEFDVSWLMLTGEPARVKTPFALGPVTLQPRADLLFRTSESVWYFAVIRSASGSKAITADIQLRRDGKPIAARTFTPNMNEIAPGLFLLGEELPAGQLATGAYSLYLVVHHKLASEVRRADFRVGS